MLEFCHMLGSTLSAAVTSWYHRENCICMAWFPESSRLTSQSMNNDWLSFIFWAKKLTSTHCIHCRSDAGFSYVWDSPRLWVPSADHHHFLEICSGVPGYFIILYFPIGCSTLWIGLGLYINHPRDLCTSTEGSPDSLPCSTIHRKLWQSWFS